MNKRLNSRGVNSISIKSQLCEKNPKYCLKEIN